MPADDTSVTYSLPDISVILISLKHGCKNAINWLGDSGMKANLDKSQCMHVLSADPLEQQRIGIKKQTDIELVSEPHD